MNSCLRYLFFGLAVAISLKGNWAFGNEQAILLKAKTHLRSGDAREWSRFPKKSPGAKWETKFDSAGSGKSKTLVIRQVDVRRNWNVQLNGKKIGSLKKDQNDLVLHIELNPTQLKENGNVLQVIGTDEKNSDDIWLGPIELVDSSSDELVNECKLNLTVSDLVHREPLPSRITIVDKNGSLIPLGAKSNDRLAVREGVVYTVDGKAEIGLPAGEYEVFANRGFEYSQDKRKVVLKHGDSKSVHLEIQRAVDTEGFVACDTHVHTLTHSGHGDCLIGERMITLAGEGLELPIATDHNKQIDYRPELKKKNAGRYFTPLIGNEVTTDFGHFNSFPFSPDAPVPNHKENDWNVLLPSIHKLGAKVIILNHARDIHRGYRPFDPSNFNSVTGQSLNGRPFLFNAMEVINSAAQQTDQYELFRDWMALLNGGHQVIPIGSSDSHDVNAFIVGQGRTYIRVDDKKPGELDTHKAIENMLAGKITVSCGLWADIKVNDKYTSGDLVPSEESLTVTCRMAGPQWLIGNRFELYENGVLVKEKNQEPFRLGHGWGVKVDFELKKRKHDSFLVLLARGPGYLHPAWRLSQPYQPTGPKWNPDIFGFTGAVYVDADGNGEFNCARSYAKEFVKKHDSDLTKIVDELVHFDEAVAAQVAGLIHQEKVNLFEPSMGKIWKAGPPQVRKGFTSFLNAWRMSISAKKR